MWLLKVVMGYLVDKGMSDLISSLCVLVIGKPGGCAPDSIIGALMP